MTPVVTPFVTPVVTPVVTSVGTPFVTSVVTSVVEENGHQGARTPRGPQFKTRLVLLKTSSIFPFQLDAVSVLLPYRGSALGIPLCSLPSLPFFPFTTTMGCP